MRLTTLLAVCSVLGLGVAPKSARADDEPLRSDHPPKIEDTARVEPRLPDWYQGDGIALRAGRTTRITFRTNDPDDDALTHALTPLPAGASFDPQQGILTWRASNAQVGRRELTLTATDGRLSAKRSFTFVVQPNRPPSGGPNDVITFRTVREGRNAAAAEPSANSSVFVRDVDGDDIACEVRKMPRGGQVVVTGASASFVWSPTAADIGDHELVVDVSDGDMKTTIRQTVVVIPQWEEDDHQGWLLPGGGPSAFVSHGDGEMFLGGTVDITFAAGRKGARANYRCSHRIPWFECQASHRRFYGQFEVLASTRSSMPSLFTYAAGYSASLEARPARRYLIPHYGIDAGGLVRAGLGHRAQVHPYLGLHLWASDALWVDATLGYRVTPSELRNLSGPTLALRAILNAW